MDCRNLTPEKYDFYTQERIKEKSVVNEITGCWIWKGSKGPGGYGSIRYYGKTNTPHKVSYIVFNGPVPDGMIVRHMCHNKACVNPEHLELGTQADNIRDTVDDGRFNKPKGSKHPNSKLSEDDVRDLRRYYELLRTGDYGITKMGKMEACRHLASLWKLSPNYVVQIVNRKVWQHV